MDKWSHHTWHTGAVPKWLDKLARKRDDYEIHHGPALFDYPYLFDHYGSYTVLSKTPGEFSAFITQPYGTPDDFDHLALKFAEDYGCFLIIHNSPGPWYPTTLFYEYWPPDKVRKAYQPPPVDTGADTP